MKSTKHLRKEAKEIKAKMDSITGNRKLDENRRLILLNKYCFILRLLGKDF